MNEHLGAGADGNNVIELPSRGAWADAQLLRTTESDRMRIRLTAE